MHLFEIGPREIVEVSLFDKDLRALVVNIEKRLKVVEVVTAPHFVNGPERDGDLVALGQLEH